MSELKQLSAEEYDRFRALIYKETGIAVPDGKITLLSNRVRRRLRAHGLDSFDDYYRLLAKGSLAGELERFIDAITTNETSFFRTAAHFDWFSGPFIDSLTGRPAGPAGVVRIWSAACSTGEEPYTLAICLAENRRRLAGRRFEILGTDISATALAAARKATYGGRAVEGLDPGILARSFTADPAAGTWTVVPELARTCVFRRHNLMEPVAGGPFDCIFIRNVLIYFDRPSKEVVVRNVVAALRPGGHLVVGPTEGIHELLGSLVKLSNFLYQKP